MVELKQQVISGATGESTDTQTSVLFLLSALQGLFRLVVNVIERYVNVIERYVNVIRLVVNVLSDFINFA